MALRSALARASLRFALLLIASLGASVLALAQPVQTYNWTDQPLVDRNEYGEDSAVDSLGNQFVVGYTKNSAGKDYQGIVAKISPTGVLLWTKTIADGDATTLDIMFSVVIDGADNVYVGGRVANQMYLGKYNNAGAELWHKNILRGVSRSTVNGLVVANGGGVAIAGYDENFNTGAVNIDLLRYDEDGTLLWSKQPGAGNFCQVSVDGADDFFLYGGGSVFAYDATGSFRYSYATGYGSRAFAVDANGYAYVLTEANFKLYITKLSLQGQVLYLTELDPNQLGGMPYPGKFTALPNGEVVASGFLRVSVNNVVEDLVATWKFDVLGNVKWGKTWSIPRSNGDKATVDFGHTHFLDNVGNIYTTMSYYYTPQQPVCAIIKYNADGARIWPDSAQNFLNGALILPSLSMANGSHDSHGNFYVGGGSNHRSDSGFSDGVPSLLRGVKFSDHSIIDLRFVPNLVTGGATTTGTATLESPVVGASAVVGLTATAGLSVPPNIAIATGANKGTFQATGVNSGYGIIFSSITATYNGSTFPWSIAVFPANRAQFVSQNVPTTMLPGHTYPITLQFKNVGQTTWDTAHGYMLQSQATLDNKIWGFNRIALSNSPVPPGSIGTFSATVTAPTTLGTYNFQWIPIQNDINAGFGPRSDLLHITVDTHIDDASFVSRSGPTDVSALSTFVSQNTMKNTGTSIWSTAAGYSMVSINPANNTTWGINKIALPGNTTVAPNISVTFVGQCTAPVTPGTYSMQWQVARSGNPFGAPTPITMITVSPILDNAQYVSETIPASLFAGATFTAKVTMLNTGPTTWTQSGGYCLISRDPFNNKIWGTNRLLIPSSANVTQGNSIECFNTLTAPVTPGTYSMQWQMYRNGVTFGELSPKLTITVAANPDNSQYITQKSIISMVPGSSLTATVTMKNTGTSTWRQAGGYCMLSQNPSNNTIWGTNRLLVPASASVAPGATVVCMNTVKAPVTPGTYGMQWRMYHNGVLFGSLTPVQLVTVSGASVASSARGVRFGRAFLVMHESDLDKDRKQRRFQKTVCLKVN